jgi:hypothetical protein
MKAAMMAHEKATAMKSFNLARLKYRVKLAQVKLDFEVRDKGKAIAAKKEETAGAIRIGKSGCDMKNAVFGTFSTRSR